MTEEPDFLPLEEIYSAQFSEPPTPAKKSDARLWSVADLYDADFPEPRYIVPGVFSEGLNILAGRPKKGKSWMGLQLAGAIACGGLFLDKRLEQGRVLYLALEDSPRRIKNRLIKQGIPRTAPIDFFYAWAPMHEGGMQELLAEIERENYRLVVIDTVTRAFRGLDHNKDGARIGAVMSDLQHFVITRNLGSLAIDHTRKPNGLDLNPIDDVMGTTNKAGVADVVTAIYTERGKTGATFLGEGREIENFDLTIHFDGLTCTWQLVGTTAEVETSKNRQEILDVLTTGGRMQFGDIVKAVQRNKSNVHHELADMWTGGKVRKIEEAGKTYYERV